MLVFELFYCVRINIIHSDFSKSHRWIKLGRLSLAKRIFSRRILDTVLSQKEEQELQTETTKQEQACVLFLTYLTCDLQLYDLYGLCWFVHA